MGPARSVAFIGAICSFLKVSALRNGIPAGAPDNAVILNKDVGNNEEINRLTMVAANCGRMVIRGGLDIGESVKVTVTGWKNDENDMTVSLVAESNLQANRIEGAEKEVKNIMETGGEHPASGAGAERPAIPIVGVTIHKKGSNGGMVTVLEYGKGEGNPTATTLDSKAGPDTPTMIFFQMITKSEMKVTVSAWIQDAGDSEVSGRWSDAVTIIGVPPTSRDVGVHVNDVGPKTLKIYTSASANFFTAQYGKCEESDMPLITIRPSPGDLVETDGKNEVPDIEDKDAKHEVPDIEDKDAEHEVPKVEDKDAKHEVPDIEDKDAEHEVPDVEDKDAEHELPEVEDDQMDSGTESEA